MALPNDPLAWLMALPDQLAAEGRAVLVTTANTQGSTPREAGSAMLVGRDSFAGTIGGGHLEFEALRIAREALDAPFTPATWLVRYPLAARLGQCCGGVATLAFSNLDGTAAKWVDAALSCVRTGASFVLAARIAHGDGAASRLIVTPDDVRGNLDDGALESAAIAAARTRLAARAGGATVIDSRGESSVLLHVIEPRPFDVLVFGNGHVGRALVQVLGALPATVKWIDEREEDFPAAVPGNVECLGSDAPVAEVARAPRGACVVIVTHSHPLDLELVHAALLRDDWTYVGLIGSKAKRAQFERRLLARGVVPEALQRIVCPIGMRIDGLRSKEPGVIAVGVAAEILALRERAAGVTQPLARNDSRKGVAAIRSVPFDVR